MEPSTARSETALQLDSLRARIAEANPDHYRHWALYLQVLREGLNAAVNKACFHLAVEVYPQRYRAMSLASRQQLHRRIGQLVHRCSSLLTVEQLLALAAQQRRRRQRRAERQQSRWLASLQEPSAPLFDTPEGPGAQPDPEPAGSVHLGLGLPINIDLFASSSIELSPETRSTKAEPEGDSRSVDDPDPSDPLLEHSELLQAFARFMDQTSTSDASDAGSDHGSEVSGLLPTHPLRLLHWLDELDTALARRLLNLSHALNVELVRLGLTRTLLPMQLLEAAGAGQVDVQNAPLNLVRCPVPVEHLPEGFAHTAMAVLVRQADLEADQPRLRTCRSRLRQVRQEVRRMAQTYQRLERRLQALEAEQLWLHDHSTAQNPSPRRSP